MKVALLNILKKWNKLPHINTLLEMRSAMSLMATKTKKHSLQAKAEIVEIDQLLNNISMKKVTYHQLGLNGRIGNCMFQIAATIGYGYDHGYDYIFPDWEHSHIYKHKIPIMPSIVYKLQFNEFKTINEAAFHYSALPVVADEKVNLMGYFQSKKYWHKWEKTVHHFFELRNDLLKKIEWYDYVRNHKMSCSIHVRRGDYLLPHAQAYHGVLPLQYYQKAVETLYGSDTNDVLFVICSDDIEWCKENFAFKNMIFGDNSNEYGDMYLMAACNDNIIANSSYSWWSAELNKNESKRIVAPAKWFNNAPLQTQDIYHQNWIIL